MALIAEREYLSLQAALDTYGILEPIAPAWLPDGFAPQEVSVAPQVDMVRIRASYQTDDKMLSVLIRQYDSPERIDNCSCPKARW